MPIKQVELKARFSHGLGFNLSHLSDSVTLELLQSKAYTRGLELNDEVAAYIMHHYSQDLRGLFDFVESLEDRVWENQCKITIPFLKKNFLSE